MTIRWLESLGDADLPLAGSKITRLAELARIGLTVPPGFVVTTDTFLAHLQTSGLGNAIDIEVARIGDPFGRAAIHQQDEAPAHRHEFALAVISSATDGRFVSGKDRRLRCERTRSVVRHAKKFSHGLGRACHRVEIAHDVQHRCATAIEEARATTRRSVHEKQKQLTEFAFCSYTYSMVRRKGELSSASIDSGWPHQVALPATSCIGRNFVLIHDFCRSLSLCPRGHFFYRGDEGFNVFCFREREHAELFQSRFGGEFIAPRERPGWPGARK